MASPSSQAYIIIEFQIRGLVRVRVKLRNRVKVRVRVRVRVRKILN